MSGVTITIPKLETGKSRIGTSNRDGQHSEAVTQVTTGRASNYRGGNRMAKRLSLEGGGRGSDHVRDHPVCVVVVTQPQVPGTNTSSRISSSKVGSRYGQQWPETGSNPGAASQRLPGTFTGSPPLLLENQRPRGRKIAPPSVAGRQQRPVPWRSWRSQVGERSVAAHALHLGCGHLTPQLPRRLGRTGRKFWRVVCGSQTLSLVERTSGGRNWSREIARSITSFDSAPAPRNLVLFHFLRWGAVGRPSSS